MYTDRRSGSGKVWHHVGIMILAATSGSRCLASDSPASQPAPEIRAIWVHIESRFSADPQTGRAQVRRFVERAARANLNLILPWIRSEYIAALDDPSYASACPVARWDALGELIQAARERGISVHPWYSFTYYKSSASPEFNPKHGGNPAWAARRIDELIPDAKTGKTVDRRFADCCPRHAEARAWQVRWIEHLLDRYPTLDGFHIEEPGFGYPGNCVCDQCLREFREQRGKDLKNIVDGPEAADFKCIATTAFVDALRPSLLRRGPKFCFSINGGCSAAQERSLGRDWGRWARGGSMDVYYAQDYTPDMQAFRQNAAQVLGDLKGTMPVALGIGIMWSGGRNDVKTVIAQIATARELGASGVALFSGEEIPEELWTALKEGPFGNAAPLPVPKRK